MLDSFIEDNASISVKSNHMSPFSRLQTYNKNKLKKQTKQTHKQKR